MFLRLRHAASPCVFRSRALFNIARTHNSQWGTNEKRKFALTWKSSQHSRSLRSYPLPIIPLCLSREEGVISFFLSPRPPLRKKKNNKNAWSQVKHSHDTPALPSSLSAVHRMKVDIQLLLLNTPRAYRSVLWNFGGFAEIWRFWTIRVFHFDKTDDRWCS